jgi:hypothetical protein
MPKSKISALLQLLVVFGSGILVGVVGHRLYTVSSVTAVRPSRPDPEEVRKRLVQEMRSRVKLDQQQVTDLNRIYDETRQEFDRLHKTWNGESRALWDKQNDRIKAILRPDQVPLYDQLRAEREQERKRRHQGPPPPPPGK